jgi:HK97 family phage major capsid protein
MRGQMSTATKTIRQLREEALSLAQKAEPLYAKGEDATPEELAEAKGYTDQAEAIEKRLMECDHSEAAKTANRISNTFGTMLVPDRPPMGGGGGTDGVGTDRRGHVHSLKAIGQLIFEAEPFHRWHKSLGLGEGVVPEGMSINSPKVDLRAVMGESVKSIYGDIFSALKTLYTTAGDITSSRPLLGQPDRRPEVVQLGWAPLNLRSLVTNLTTNSDAVEVVRELSRTNNADIVAEATDVDDGTGEKPQSDIAWELTTINVVNVAHWVATSTRVLSDARRLQSEIEAFLRRGIDDRVETLMLVGTDTNFKGVRNTTGILTQAWVASGDHHILTTTRKARTKLRVSGRAMPTAWVFHPNDWEGIDLLTDGEERYLYQGPFALGAPRLWGIPVVEAEQQTEGYAELGDWRDAVIYDREQSSVRVSNQHADFFVRNLLAILGEARMAFHVRRPKSFIDVDVAA